MQNSTAYITIVPIVNFFLAVHIGPSLDCIYSHIQFLIPACSRELEQTSRRFFFENEKQN
jgi:hypothetical protein